GGAQPDHQRRQFWDLPRPHLHRHRDRPGDRRSLAAGVGGAVVDEAHRFGGEIRQGAFAAHFALAGRRLHRSLIQRKAPNGRNAISRLDKPRGTLLKKVSAAVEWEGDVWITRLFSLRRWPNCVTNAATGCSQTLSATPAVSHVPNGIPRMVRAT